MSSTIRINWKGTGADADEAEGHGWKGPQLDDGTSNDAEGHGRFSPRDSGLDDDDVEGHGYKGP